MPIHCQTIEEYALCNTGYSADELWEMLREVEMGVASGHTISEVFRDNPSLPSSVWFWDMHLRCREAADFVDQARRSGAYALADRSIDTALTADDSNAKIARVRMQAMQWVASKHHKERYGNHVQHEVSGGIDLRAAIDAGARRAEQLRPIRDLELHPAQQAIDNKRQSLAGPGVAQSPLAAVKSDMRPRRQWVVEARKRARREQERREQEDSQPGDDEIPW